MKKKETTADDKKIVEEKKKTVEYASGADKGLKIDVPKVDVEIKKNA